MIHNFGTFPESIDIQVNDKTYTVYEVLASYQTVGIADKIIESAYRFLLIGVYEDTPILHYASILVESKRALPQPTNKQEVMAFCLNQDNWKSYVEREGFTYNELMAGVR
jgi:hypothetical protein